jgi:hypothetical protein
MTGDDEVLTRLIGFGLSEKEAQLYLHLLRYGPKTPSPIAKSLKTYREDVRRTLSGLIDKGMVRPGDSKPLLEVSDMRNNEPEGEPEPCLYCGKPAVCVVFEHFSVCAACYDEVEDDRIFENAQREYDAMVIRWRSEC